MNLTIIGAFLGAGLWLGPYAHTAYDRAFPEPPYVVGNYAAILQRADKPVVLFSTSTCPHCQHAREFLRAQKVDYADFVIQHEFQIRLPWWRMSVALPVLAAAALEVARARDGRRTPCRMVRDL